MRFLLLLIFLFLASTALAEDIKFEWDANDSADQVRYYNLYQDGLKVAAILGTLTTATLSNVNGDAHSYYIKAENGRGEAPASNTVTIDALPKAVKGLTVTTHTTTTVITTTTTLP